MSDGARLSADLYLPSGPGPWPVLLERTPYNKEASVEVIQVGSPAYFASRGYAVVIQDTRGPFQLGGRVLPLSRRRLGRKTATATIPWKLLPVRSGATAE